jgi:hypothetical protein
VRVVEFVKLLDERHFRSGRARFGLWDLRLIGNAEAVLSVGSLTLSSLHLSNKPKCQSFMGVWNVLLILPKGSQGSHRMKKGQDVSLTSLHSCQMSSTRQEWSFC